MRRGKKWLFLIFSTNLKTISVGNNFEQSNQPMACFMSFFIMDLIRITMTDVDFIRLSALVFATRLIGIAQDPVSEGTEMAERLFDKLKEKEEQ